MVASPNNINSKFAIVHQYDRWHNYQVALAISYVYWTDCSNENILWKSENACKKYKYVANDDLFRGVCDIGNFRALTSSSCCQACDLKVHSTTKQKCVAFAYTEGKCFFKSCSTVEFNNVIKNKENYINQNSIIPNGSINLMSAYKIS